MHKYRAHTTSVLKINRYLNNKTKNYNCQLNNYIIKFNKAGN